MPLVVILPKVAWTPLLLYLGTLKGCAGTKQVQCAFRFAVPGELRPDGGAVRGHVW